MSKSPSEDLAQPSETQAVVPTTSRVPRTTSYAGNVLVAVTLLASINVAVLVVPVADNNSQPRLGFLPGTPDQVAVVTGLVGTSRLLWAVVKLLGIVFVADDTTPSYTVPAMSWINGVGAFMLTVGLVAHSKVPLALPVVAGVATALVIVSIWAACAKVKKLWPIFPTLTTVGGCVWVFFASL